MRSISNKSSSLSRPSIVLLIILIIGNLVNLLFFSQINQETSYDQTSLDLSEKLGSSNLSEEGQETLMLIDETHQSQDLAAKQNPYHKYNQIKKYDNQFKKYSKRYFGPNFDYLYFKSQAIVESNLKQNVISPIGAQGIMQVMPLTYLEVVTNTPELKNIDNYNNIAIGIYYMHSIWIKWKPKETWYDHWCFAAGSYNAGRGNIIKAQKLANEDGLNTEIWDSIRIKLPLVTKHHSKETINYIDRIKMIRDVLI